MDVIESIRAAVRNRIFAAGIVDIEHYQEEFKNAPDYDDFYVRERIVDMGRVEQSQTTELQTILCEYDVIVNRLLLNPTVFAYNVVEKLRAEFSVKDPEKIKIALPSHPNVQAWVRDPVTTAAAEQDGDYYRLPVFIYVECLVSYYGK